MTTISRLTDGSLTPGLYRVLGPPHSIATALDEAGWTSVIIEPASRTREFYAALAAAMHLPDYFGRNLDALWDCLTDLDRPTVLILVDWTRFARARPDRWDSIMNVFADRSRIAPAFAVVLA